MTQSDNRSLSTQIRHLRVEIEVVREEATMYDDPEDVRPILDPLLEELEVLLKQDRALRVFHGRP